MSPPDDLRTLKSVVGNAHVLHVSGVVDYVTAPRFTTEVMDFVQGPPGPLLVDLTETTYVDSAGISTLVKAHETLAERGQRLTLIVSTPVVLRVLSIFTLDAIFAIYHTLDDGLAAVDAGFSVTLP
jgi:anti-anti-sigma factor